MNNENFVKIMQGALKAGEITGAANMCDSVVNMIGQLKKSLESQKLDIQLPEMTPVCEWIDCSNGSYLRPIVFETVLIIRQSIPHVEFGYCTPEGWFLLGSFETVSIDNVLFWCAIPCLPDCEIKNNEKLFIERLNAPKQGIAPDNSPQARAARIEEVMKRRHEAKGRKL